MKLGILLLLNIVIFACTILVLYKIHIMVKSAKSAVPSTMTRQEIILNCQKIAATANEKWNYKNCLDELQKPVSGELRGI